MRARDAAAIVALVLAACGSTRTLSTGVSPGWIGRDFAGGDGVRTSSAWIEYAFHIGAKKRHDAVLAEARKSARATNSLVDAWLVAEEKERARHEAAMALAKERHEADLEAHRLEDEQRKAIAKREGELWDLILKVATGLATALLAALGFREVRKRRAAAQPPEIEPDDDGPAETSTGSSL